MASPQLLPAFMGFVKLAGLPIVDGLPMDLIENQITRGHAHKPVGKRIGKQRVW